MARSIPIDWVMEEGEIIPLTVLDEVDKPVNTSRMTCGNLSSGISGQAMVDQTPRYDNQLRRKKKRRVNQVVGKSGIIRPDKRLKAKYL